MELPNDLLERRFREKKLKVAGLDEAGRGPLAGPVVAAAVILPADIKKIDGLNDSKKLSEAKREELYEIFGIQAGNRV